MATKITQCALSLAFAGAMIVGLGSAVPAFADVETGHAAWNRGDYELAVSSWRDLADSGDADAQFNMAQAYRMGRGVERDEAQAQTLIAKAATQGHAPAIDLHGLILYRDGRKSEALPFLEMSADSGNSRAQYLLGIAHFNGELVAKDTVRAYALLTLSSANGLTQADAAIAQMDKVLSPEIRRAARRMARTMSSEPEMVAELEGRAADKPQRSVLLVDLPPEAKAAEPAADARPFEAASDGPWRIQLGTFGVRGNADGLWSELSGNAALAGKKKRIVSSGRFSVLSVGGFATRSDARSACRALKRSTQDCLPVR